MINLQENKRKKPQFFTKTESDLKKRKITYKKQKNIQEMSEENIVANHRKLK